MRHIDAEGALRLIEQLQGQHEFEDGLIDPSDWETFTAEDLLRVAAGETSIQALVWGNDAGSDREALAAEERRKLAAWNANATVTGV